MLERLTTMSRPNAERAIPPVWLRRTSAVLAVLLYPVITLGLEADLSGMRDSVGPIGYAAALAIPSLVWIGAFVIITTFRRQLAQAPDAQLDERERQVRDGAHLHAYRLLSLIVAGGTLWLLVAAPLFGMDREVSLDVVLAGSFSLLLAAAALPAAVVAWQDSDIEVDVDDDPDAVPPRGDHLMADRSVVDRAR